MARPFFTFPRSWARVVPTYNIPGVSGALNFTPDALAGIFLGKITKWNDPAIAGANKGVNLPATDIVVVHRSDGSGTTYIWTDYLAKVSDEWKSKVSKGTSVNWPVGLGGKGNEGVTGLVKQTPNSIGYVELIYAVQNKHSLRLREEFLRRIHQGRSRQRHVPLPPALPKICPTISASRSPTRRARPPIQSPALPGCSMPQKIQDGAKRDAIKGFLKWMLSDGQSTPSSFPTPSCPKKSSKKKRKLSTTFSSTTEDCGYNFNNPWTAGPATGSRSFLSGACERATKSRGCSLFFSPPPLF